MVAVRVAGHGGGDADVEGGGALVAVGAAVGDWCSERCDGGGGGCG